MSGEVGNSYRSREKLHKARKPKYLYSVEYRAKLYTIPRSWE